MSNFPNPPAVIPNNTPASAGVQPFHALNGVEIIHYNAPSSLSCISLVEGALTAVEQPSSSDNCSICWNPLSDEKSVKIQGCSHSFHESCIEECLKREPKCPMCKRPIGEPQGPCPSGVMEIRLSQMPCPGFDATNAIQIEYSINRGTQKSYHDNPGQYFMGTRRVAYLPNNDDGLRLLARLKYAWRRGLTFSVGTSLTTGMSNVVVWSSIHHKTSLHGGPHSFPDPNYLNNCNGSLDALYVPDPDTCLQKLASVATDVIENVTRRGVPSSPSRMPRVNDTRQEIIPYDAPVSFSSSPSVTAALAISKKVDCDCSICLDPLNKGSVIQIQKCGHTFHKKCLEDCLDSQPLCPICREPVGLQGMSPSGTMAVNFINQTCPGFACTSTIQINYFIPPGIQKSYHENPGMRHGSTTRMAYLPNNGEGKSILTRLKYAWKHGLTFNIGTSLTTGERNVVVWAGIPHKTSLRGGLYGFPDNTYFAQCHSSLAAAGVPNEDACV